MKQPLVNLVIDLLNAGLSAHSDTHECQKREACSSYNFAELRVFRNKIIGLFSTPTPTIMRLSVSIWLHYRFDPDHGCGFLFVSIYQRSTRLGSRRSSHFLDKKLKLKTFFKRCEFFKTRDKNLWHLPVAKHSKRRFQWWSCVQWMSEELLLNKISDDEIWVAWLDSVRSLWQFPQIVWTAVVSWQQDRKCLVHYTFPISPQSSNKLCPNWAWRSQTDRSYTINKQIIRIWIMHNRGDWGVRRFGKM